MDAAYLPKTITYLQSTNTVTASILVRIMFSLSCKQIRIAENGSKSIYF